MPDVPTASRRRPALDVRLLIGLALVVGSVAGVLAIVSAGDRRTTVYAAASSLSPGDRIDDDDLVLRQVSLDSAEHLYLEPGDVPDGGLVVGAVVRAGELVSRTAVAISRGRALDVARARSERSRQRSRRSGRDGRRVGGAQSSGEVATQGAFGPPVVLTADAVVIRVVDDEGIVAASEGDAVEVLIPRSRIARLLQAIANGDSLAVVPAGIALGDQ